MKKYPAIFLLSFFTMMATAAIFVQNPIYLGLLQSDENGNGFSITNLNSVTATNFNGQFNGNGGGLTNVPVSPLALTNGQQTIVTFGSNVMTTNGVFISIPPVTGSPEPVYQLFQGGKTNAGLMDNTYITFVGQGDAFGDNMLDLWQNSGVDRAKGFHVLNEGSVNSSGTITAAAGSFSNSLTLSGNGVATNGAIIPAANLQYNRFPLFWNAYGDSWLSGINGNTGLLDTNVTWVYQAARSLNWIFNNLALAGNTVEDNNRYIWTNPPQAGQGTLFDLCNNDARGALTVSNFQSSELAQMSWCLFATNDPGMFSSLKITNATAQSNGVFFPANSWSAYTNWGYSYNNGLTGYLSTTNGNSLTITNGYGSSFIVCLNAYTNGTGAYFTIWVDGNLMMTNSCNKDIWGGEGAGPTNTQPFAVCITNLSAVNHIVIISNCVYGSASNLCVNWIAFPDLRASTPMLIAVQGAADPPNGNGWGSTERVNGAQRTNVYALQQMGFPVSCFQLGSAIPYGPHGTVDSGHPTPAEYTNMAVAFTNWISSIRPPSMFAHGNDLNAISASFGNPVMPLSISTWGQFQDLGHGGFQQLRLFQFPFYLSDGTGNGQIEMDGSGQINMKGTGSGGATIYGPSSSSVYLTGGNVTMSSPNGSVNSSLPFSLPILTFSDVAHAGFNTVTVNPGNFPFYYTDGSSTGQIEFDGSGKGNIKFTTGLTITANATNTGNFVVQGTNFGNGQGLTNVQITNLAGGLVPIANGIGNFSSGRSTVSTSSANSTNIIQVTYYARDGTNSTYSVQSITNGTSFTVVSGNAVDTNSFFWTVSQQK